MPGGSKRCMRARTACDLVQRAASLGDRRVLDRQIAGGVDHGRAICAAISRSRRIVEGRAGPARPDARAACCRRAASVLDAREVVGEIGAAAAAIGRFVAAAGVVDVARNRHRAARRLSSRQRVRHRRGCGCRAIAGGGRCSGSTRWPSSGAAPRRARRARATGSARAPPRRRRPARGCDICSSLIACCSCGVSTRLWCLPQLEAGPCAHAPCRSRTLPRRGQRGSTG